MADWIVYCDICGQRYPASKTVTLPTNTGRGGLVVCRHDADSIDFGLIPYTVRKEQTVPFIRSNHTNTTLGSPLVDLEEMAYIYYLTSSQDNIILTPSQNIDQGLSVTESF